MKYLKLYKLLTEKNVYYKIPKDKEKLLFDFYMLTLLKNLPKAKKNTFSRDDQDINYSVKEGAEDIVDYLISHLKDAIEFAIAAEFRHIFDDNGPTRIKKFFDKYGEKKFIKKYAQEYKIDDAWLDRDKKTDRTLDRFKDNLSVYKDSYKAIKKTGISTSKFMKMAADAFRNLSWNEHYGREPWAQIAEGWLMLNNAKTYNQKVIAIDHAYDLQHNTDTVFNKLKSYYKGGYEWVKRALDYKAKIKNVWELFDKVSGPVKTMTGYIAKDRGYGSLENFKVLLKKNKVVNDLSKPSSFKLKFNDDGIGKDAKYTINTNGEYVWHDGTWFSGTWPGGTWFDGEFKTGVWKKGSWYNGHWKGGVWEGGLWKNGTWDNGVWFGGKWKGGIWKDGQWIDGWIYDPDKKGNYKEDWKWSLGSVRSPISPKEYFKEVKK